MWHEDTLKHSPLKFVTIVLRLMLEIYSLAWMAYLISLLGLLRLLCLINVFVW